MVAAEDKIQKEAMDRDAVAMLLGGQRDPIGFMTSCLDVQPRFVWPKMVEVAEAVRDYPRVAVKAGHSVSKSYTAARLALWFLVCHPPATVVTTAPTHKQVEDILWREIAAAHAGAKIPIGGKLTTTNLDLGPKWFATGFSTRPDTVTRQATAFQGYHNTYVLIILDEAAGIMPQIWEAADSLLASGYCRLLAIGNPTSAYGRFAECFKSGSDYKQITISVLDTPNYILDNEDVIPGLSGRKYERTTREAYGENSNYYRSRVLGEIPDCAEGAIYGKEIKESRSTKRICRFIDERAAVVHTAWDLGIGDCTAIWFFQCVGQEIHLVDYYENSGEGLTHYIAVLDRKRQEKGWIYGRHFGPHDLEQRELSTGNTRLETARTMGIPFDVLERTSLEDGIEAARQIFPRCWFREDTCGDGLKALAEYHWKKIEKMSTDEKPVYSRNPEHDWSSHGADAFRYLAQAYKRGLAAAGRIGSDARDWDAYYRRTA